MVDPTDSVTVRWCPPMPGRTIGYWGNKMGAPMVIDSLADMKDAYPNALSSVPSLSSQSSVRAFFRNANCSGTCESMFAAQFLATAMNALDMDFAAQGVAFGDTCMSVEDLLEAANADVMTDDKEWYAMYKSIFDDINNSRQSTCLTVVD